MHLSRTRVSSVREPCGANETITVLALQAASKALRGFTSRVSVFHAHLMVSSLVHTLYSCRFVGFLDNFPIPRLRIGGLGHLAIQYAAKFGYTVVAISRGTSKKAQALELGVSRSASLIAATWTRLLCFAAVLRSSNTIDEPVFRRQKICLPAVSMATVTFVFLESRRGDHLSPVKTMGCLARIIFISMSTVGVIRAGSSVVVAAGAHVGFGVFHRVRGNALVWFPTRVTSGFWK